MKKIIYIVLIILVVVIILGIIDNQSPKMEPMPARKGVLISEIPENMDIIFPSIRYVLQGDACLDKNRKLKKNFTTDLECNTSYFSQETNELTAPRQLYLMDIDSGDVEQLTNNMDCFYVNGQVVDRKTIMTNAIFSDTNGDGNITEKDHNELYLLDLSTEKMECLTCGLGLDSINNPDYSKVNKKIVFSGRAELDARFPHHIYTIDLNKKLSQITFDPNYYDFDCAWSEDGESIVFNRSPIPMFSKPAQVWLMDKSGKNMTKITDGGKDPNNEGKFNEYPIGVDADPDTSPDNKKVAFSRLKTGKGNVPFGVWELVVVDVETKEEEVLDSRFSNYVPEWKERGILFLRYTVGKNPLERHHSLYIYNNGKFSELEKAPYNNFPFGGFGGSWISL